MSNNTLPILLGIIVPCVLTFLGAAVQKVVDGKPFNRKHFYLGPDLTLYFLATCFVNLADMLKEHPGVETMYRMAWTGVLIAVAFSMLFFQTAVHQEFESDGKTQRSQLWTLCVASNGVGFLMTGAFVVLKMKGTV